MTKEIEEFGNGVYYFPFGSGNREFQKTLSSFIGEHPGLRLCGVSVSGGNGTGFIVVFEKRR